MVCLVWRVIVVYVCSAFIWILNAEETVIPLRVVWEKCCRVVAQWGPCDECAQVVLS